MGGVFGRLHQPSQGNPTSNDLQLTRSAAREEVNQSTQVGNGEAPSSAGVPTDNPSNPLSTARHTAQSNQEQVPPPERVQRADPMKVYEKELNRAWRWACGISSLHAFSQFLAFCNLTIASVVLLGAFVPYLIPADFDSVMCLLLFEGVRLTSASFFTHLLNSALAYLSQDPKEIEHNKDDHYHYAKWARNCSRAVQCIFTFPGLIMPGFRIFSGLHQYEYTPADTPNKVRNVQKSLYIFYICVFINSVVGLVNLVCSPIASYIIKKKFPQEQSILRYFDKVLKNAMGVGVVQAGDFDLFDFAFTMLAGEFRRNVQPEAVAKNHKQLIQYIYANRLGVDFVRNYMDAEDAFVQLAAVNMVGFWADTAWGVGVPSLRLSEELLTKLADKMGTGQVGWAATTSMGVVVSSSQIKAEVVARIRSSGGVHLPDRLANLVDSSSRSLSLVRSLGAFYEKACEGKKEPPKPFKEEVEMELVSKLKKLAREAKVHRLRVQSAYLLRLMSEECDSETIEVIGGIDPTQDKYWFQSEVDMLKLLRRVINTNSPVFKLPPKIIKDREKIAPPIWVVQATQKVGGLKIDPTNWTGAIVQPTEEVRAEDVQPTGDACSTSHSSQVPYFSLKNT